MLEERYRGKYTDDEVTAAWEVLCSANGHTTDGINLNYHIDLAAAIWLLDVLNQSGQFWKAMPILEMEPEKIKKIYLPDVHDAKFSDRVVREMVYLVKCRDGLEDGFRSYISIESAKRKEPVVHRAPQDGRPISEWTDRERFNAIMEMIHPAYIERAVNRFETAMWEYIDLILERSHGHKEKIDLLMDKMHAMAAKNPVLRQVLQTEKGGPVMVPYATEELDELSMGTAQTMAAECIALQDEIEEAAGDFGAVVEALHLVPMFRDCECEHLNQEDVQQVRNLEIANPYETCFAYLCLLEQGSDIPWVYTAPNVVLQEAARKLPWTAFFGADHPEEDDDLEEDWTEENSEDQNEEDEEAEGAEQEELTAELQELMQREPLDWIEKEKDLYRLRYTNYPLYAPLDSPDLGWKLNLPQMVFGLTGTLMPRDVSSFDETAEDLVEAGFDATYAEALELYLQLAMDGGWTKKDHPVEQEPTEEETEAPDAPPAGEMTPEEEKESLARQLREAREETARLKAALYTAEKSAQTAEQEKAELQEQLHQETQELADLREMVYQYANDEEAAPVEEKAVSFPYQVKEKIAVFGGHDTWLKVIRPLLRGVTFIPRGQLPNADLIRSQDKIWIQPNALAHKDFYKIIHIVRAHQIPLRYFRYASAKKCALQVVDDQEGKANG